MPASDRNVQTVDLPRFVILSADFAGMVVEYLDGLDRLLALGGLSREQLRVLTSGRSAAAGGLSPPSGSGSWWRRWPPPSASRWTEPSRVFAPRPLTFQVTET